MNNIPNYTEVESDNLKGVGYDNDTQDLYVVFQSLNKDGEYRIGKYLGVNQDVWQNFFLSGVQSKGWFHKTFIKHNYLYEAVNY